MLKKSRGALLKKPILSTDEAGLRFYTASADRGLWATVSCRPKAEVVASQKRSLNVEFTSPA